MLSRCGFCDSLRFCSCRQEHTVLKLAARKRRRWDSRSDQQQQPARRDCNKSVCDVLRFEWIVLPFSTLRFTSFVNTMGWIEVFLLFALLFSLKLQLGAFFGPLFVRFFAIFHSSRCSLSHIRNYLENSMLHSSLDYFVDKVFVWEFRGVCSVCFSPIYIFWKQNYKMLEFGLSSSSFERLLCSSLF